MVMAEIWQNSIIGNRCGQNGEMECEVSIPDISMSAKLGAETSREGTKSHDLCGDMSGEHDTDETGNIWA